MIHRSAIHNIHIRGQPVVGYIYDQYVDGLPPVLTLTVDLTHPSVYD